MMSHLSTFKVSHTLYVHKWSLPTQCHWFNLPASVLRTCLCSNLPYAQHRHGTCSRLAASSSTQVSVDKQMLAGFFDTHACRTRLLSCTTAASRTCWPNETRRISCLPTSLSCTCAGRDRSPPSSASTSESPRAHQRPSLCVWSITGHDLPGTATSAVGFAGLDLLGLHLVFGFGSSRPGLGV